MAKRFFTIKTAVFRTSLTFSALLFLLLASSPAMAEKEPLGPDRWPTSVDAAVDDILSSLSAEHKQILLNTPKENLIRFHHGWGTGIRNYYGLWRGNNELLRDACDGELCHPDEASMVIIERVWEAVQEEYGE